MSEKVISEGADDAFVRRLREAIKIAGKADNFASAAGLSRNTLNKYLSGMQATAPVLVKMADAAGWSLDYLLGRTNVKRVALSDTDDGSVLTNVFGLKPGDAVVDQFLRLPDGQERGDTPIPDGFVPVPYLDVRASAGRGRASLPAETMASAHFLFREAWLRSLGVAPQHAELLTAQGDSMFPTIQDGDLMLNDRAYGDVIHGKIYTLVVNDLVVVKRVNMLAIGGMMLISDNDRYPTETILREDVNALNFQGRIAWFGRPI